MSRADPKLPVISVVIPIYGCRECLMELHKRLAASLSFVVSFELILVDDGSADNAWPVIVELAKKDPRVSGIRLSRNFGQHHAITAGVDAARGEWVVVMDCDLQDRPEEIRTLYDKAVTDGYDIVFARRRNRRDGMERKFISVVFHSLFRLLSGMEGDTSVGNFSIASRNVIDNLKTLTEQNRSYLQGLKWLGYKQGYVDVQHSKRLTGKTSYSAAKLLAYAIDSITAHSDKPLKTAIGVGFVIALIAFLYGTSIIIRYLAWGIPITGWPSLIVSLYFLSGLIIGFLGILGLYIGKIFDETKKRPLYIIQEKVHG